MRVDVTVRRGDSCAFNGTGQRIYYPGRHVWSSEKRIDRFSVLGAKRRQRSVGLARATPFFEGPKHIYTAEEYAVEEFDIDEYHAVPAYDPDDYDTASQPLKSGSPQKKVQQRRLPQVASAAAQRWKQAQQRIKLVVDERLNSGLGGQTLNEKTEVGQERTAVRRPMVLPEVLEFAARPDDDDDDDEQGGMSTGPNSRENVEQLHRPSSSLRESDRPALSMIHLNPAPAAVAVLRTVARESRVASTTTLPSLARQSSEHLLVLLSQVGLALSSTGGALCMLCANSYFGLHRSLRLLRLRLRKAVRRLRQSVPGDDFHPPPADADRWWKALLKDKLPRGWFDAFWYIWMRPWARHLRTTVGLVSFFIKAPALMVYAASKMPLLVTIGKVSLVSSGALSLPVLAPLLLGTGMLLRSITANASYVFPRIGLTVLLFWCLWFAQGLVQNIVSFLRSQGALDGRLAGGIITTSEIAAMVTGVIVLLSMLGVNVSALLLPAGVAVAFAAQDITRNFISGLFLFVVQPFRLGDRVAVSVSGGSSVQMGANALSAFGAVSNNSGSGPLGTAVSGWFEGVCEKMDLRYTCLRAGGRRLMVPNTAFMSREFLVVDDPTALGSSRAEQERLLNGVGGPPSPHYMSSVDWTDPWGADNRGDETQSLSMKQQPRQHDHDSHHTTPPVSDLDAQYVLRLLREKPVHAEVKEAAVKDGLREIFRLFSEAGRASLTSEGAYHDDDDVDKHGGSSESRMMNGGWPETSSTGGEHSPTNGATPSYTNGAQSSYKISPRTNE